MTEEHKCEECKKSFSTYTGYYKHNNKYHPEKINRRKNKDVKDKSIKIMLNGFKQQKINITGDLICDVIYKNEEKFDIDNIEKNIPERADYKLRIKELVIQYETFLINEIKRLSKTETDINKVIIRLFKELSADKDLDSKE
jgi:acetylglutamate synthase